MRARGDVSANLGGGHSEVIVRLPFPKLITRDTRLDLNSKFASNIVPLINIISWTASFLLFRRCFCMVSPWHRNSRIESVNYASGTEGVIRIRLYPSRTDFFEILRYHFVMKVLVQGRLESVKRNYLNFLTKINKKNKTTQCISNLIQ